MLGKHSAKIQGITPWSTLKKFKKKLCFKDIGEKILRQ